MNYITKTAITKSIETNMGKMQTTFSTAVGDVDVAPLMLAIVDASAHSDRSSTQWKDAAKLAYDMGITSDMLTPRIPDGVDANGKKKTKKNPGCDEKIFEAIRQANLAGISVNRPASVYSIARPDAPGADVLAKKTSAFTWSAFQVANCPTTYLVGKQDDVFKDMRTKYNGWAGGTYMGRLRGYIFDLEFPDAKRDARMARAAEKEAAAEAAASPDAPLLERGKAMVLELTAKLLTMKRPDGTTMDGVVKAHEACCEALARLGQVK